MICRGRWYPDLFVGMVEGGSVCLSDIVIWLLGQSQLVRSFHPSRLLSRLAVGKESTPPFPGWGAFYCQNWASTLVEFALAIVAASFFGPTPAGLVDRGQKRYSGKSGPQGKRPEKKNLVYSDSSAKY
ncbi:MAG TPA: hypothetical protein DIT95_14515 [Arenibacter sp.]|nr:hypothetical protein [Arenibacter sp.]